MSRRRYISTKISSDKRINQLAQKAGDFAALLYTWMIPHAEDDARLTGDPEEILMEVMPGRRDKSVEDISAALQAMHDLGLVVWNQAEGWVKVPLNLWDDERRNHTAEYRHWRSEVLTRDNFRCQECGMTIGQAILHTHHIKPWAAYPDLRHDVTNGITLCEACHRDYHRTVR